MRRNFNTLDHFFVSSKAAVQLGIRLSHPKYVEEAANNLLKIAIGFRLRAEAGQFIQSNSSNIDIHRIKGFDSLHEACDYVYDNYDPDYSKSLASLAIGSDFVVFNSSHSVADGRYLSQLLDVIMNPHNNKDITYPAMPLDVKDSYDLRLGDKCHDAVPTEFDCHCIRNFPLEKMKIKNPKLATYNFACDLTKFKCCVNKKTGKCKSYNENIWLSFIFTTAAMNQRFDKFGIGSTLDMRCFANKNVDRWALVNSFTSFVMNPKGINMDTTVGEYGLRLREDMLDKFNAGWQYKNMSRILNFVPGQTNQDLVLPPGFIVDTSNLGAFQVNRKVRDVFFQVITKGNAREAVDLQNFSIHNSEEKKHTMFGTVIYPEGLMSKREAKAYAYGVDFFMNNINHNMKTGETFEKMVESMEFFDKKL